MKPYNLGDLKAKKPILTDVDIAQWKEIIVTNIKAENTWLKFINQTWKAKGETDRGIVGDDAATKAIALERMLSFIASHAPSYTFREITARCKSLADVWNIIRRWAGVRASCSKQLNYAKLKMAYDPRGNQTPQEFYFQLRDSKEDCLITVSSGVKVNGEILIKDEILTPCLESDIVLDWLQAIGGVPLVDHVFRVFSKDLESHSLADLQERISDTLSTLITESESTAEAAQISVQKLFARRQFNNSPRGDRGRGYPRTSRGSPPPRSNRPFSDRNQQYRPNNDRARKLCRLCKAEGRPNATSHNIQDCFSLTPKETNSLKVRGTFADDTEDFDEGEQFDQSNYYDPNYPYEDDEESYPEDSTA